MKDLPRSETPSRRLRVLTLTAVALGLTATVSAQVIPADIQWFEPNDQENWVSVSAGIAFTDGDQASYQARHQVNADGFGGIEELHQVFNSDGGVLKLEARLLAGNNDFKAILDYQDESGWSLRGGFRQYRVWYDASGGYLPPPADQFIQFFDDSMTVDRGTFWVEFEMAPEQGLGAFLRYAHTYRDGQKGTTSWSATNLTGGLGQRGISPNYYDLDETRDTIEGEINYKVDETKFGLGLRYEMSDYDNRRQIRRDPGDTADRYLTHKETNETDLFSMHGYVDTAFNEQWRLSVGGIYMDMNATFGGDRIWGSSYDPIFDPGFQRQNRDEGFLDLEADTGMEQYVGNANLVFSPNKDWRVVGSLRMEKVDTDAMSDFIETNYLNGNASADELAGMSDKQFDEIGEEIEVQFGGLKSVIMYASAQWTQGDGDLRESIIEVEDGAIDLERDTGWDRNTDKYSIGANWHPTATFGIAGEFYHKVRTNDYETTQDSTPPSGGDRFPAFITYQSFTTDDINVRVTWRPDPKVTIVARVDDQQTSIDSQEEGLSRVQSGDLETRIYSGAVTFLPQGWLMLQANINYVTDKVDTGLTGSALNTVNNATNDYWIGTISAIMAVDDNTDVQVNYTAYEADNYIDNSAYTVPYGVGEKEKMIGASVTHRFSEQMMVSANYTYADFSSVTVGGYNDYTAHTLYGRVMYRF